MGADKAAGGDLAHHGGEFYSLGYLTAYLRGDEDHEKGKQNFYAVIQRSRLLARRRLPAPHHPTLSRRAARLEVVLPRLIAGTN